MSPDPRDRRRGRGGRPGPVPQPVRVAPGPGDVHEIVFFRRHPDDDAEATTPGRAALNSWPTGVRAKVRAVLAAVAAAPPNRFAGGGKWERMHGDMAGFFEVRADGPGRHHYRLFCLLDYADPSRDKPLLVVVDGRDKPFRTVLTDADYSAVRALGEEFRSRLPRSVT